MGLPRFAIFHAASAMYSPTFKGTLGPFCFRPTIDVFHYYHYEPIYSY